MNVEAATSAERSGGKEGGKQGGREGQRKGEGLVGGCLPRQPRRLVDEWLSC